MLIIFLPTPVHYSFKIFAHFFLHLHGHVCSMMLTENALVYPFLLTALKVKVSMSLVRDSLTHICEGFIYKK